jgi:hypothetical protein
MVASDPLLRRRREAPKQARQPEAHAAFIGRSDPRRPDTDADNERKAKYGVNQALLGERLRARCRARAPASQ